MSANQNSVPADAGARGNPLAYFIDLSPAASDFLSDALEGLTASPKTLSPKYFYDARGSELFDAICETEEYYVTRTELKLLEDIGPEIRTEIGADAVVVEFGAGSSVKIRLLLEALDQPAEYVAIDISGDYLRDAAGTLAEAFPNVRIGAIAADFTQIEDLPAGAGENGGPRLGFLPGSTIGNFAPGPAKDFLVKARRLLGPGGALLIGTDLKKDPAVLDRAYNDAAGVTAAFNRNVLRRLARELGSDIDPDDFDHHAFYDPDKGRVEMHLVSRQAQKVNLGEQQIDFAKGETIHTENSHKYGIEEFQSLAREAGYSPRRVWTDDANLFAVHLLDA